MGGFIRRGMINIAHLNKTSKTSPQPPSKGEMRREDEMVNIDEH